MSHSPRIAIPGDDPPQLQGSPHLDALHWPPDGKVVRGTVEPRTVDGAVVGEFSDGDRGWPWLRADYPKGGGRLVVCGFAVVQSWQASPTPRYLLLRMLESLTEPAKEPAVD